MPGGLEKLHRLSPFLACCLSPSQLISLSRSLYFSFVAASPSTSSSLYNHHFFPSVVSFSFFLAHLYQSLHVIAALLLHLPPVWHALISVSHPFLATASLFLWVLCSHRPANTPHVTHAGAVWWRLVRMGLVRWPLLSKKKCFKKGSLILKIYYR